MLLLSTFLVLVELLWGLDVRRLLLVVVLLPPPEDTLVETLTDVGAAREFAGGAASRKNRFRKNTQWNSKETSRRARTMILL